jgi:hypothetical protein
MSSAESTAQRAAPPPQARPVGILAWRISATRTRTAAVLGLIFTVSLVLRVGDGRAVPAPWIIPDELWYADLGRSFAESGRLVFRDSPTSIWSLGPLYPILISPAYLLAHADKAYELVKVLNALFWSLAAIPTYLLARRMLSRNFALLAALLAVAVPSSVYTTKVMTENVAYPTFLVGMLLLVRCLERPSTQRQLAFLGFLTIAVAARAQLIALLPAALTTMTVWAPPPGGTLGQRLRRFRLTWAVAGAGAASAAALVALDPAIFGAALGAHSVSFGAGDVGMAALWTLHHVALLDLYVGVIPMVATVLLAVRMFRGRGRTLSPLPVVTISIALWLALVAASYLVGVYGGSGQLAEMHQVRTYDRYVFYAAPLMIICMLAWIEAGAPRPRRLTASVASICGLLPVTLPLGSLLNGGEWGTSSSTVSLVPWALAKDGIGSTAILTAILGLVTVGLAMLVYTRERNALVLPVVVLTLFAVVGFVAQGQNANLAASAERTGLGVTNPGWIDRAVGANADVVAVWSGGSWPGWYGIWENEFFNSSVGRVYTFKASLPYGAAPLAISPAGVLTSAGSPLVASYVVTNRETPIQGQIVGTDASGRMILYRVGRPVLLRKSPRPFATS